MRQKLQDIQWKDLKFWQKAAIVDLALTQIGLFAAAWFDLNRRTPENINGSKKAWRAALFLNGIGPLAYFLKGRKKSDWAEADVPDMHGKVAIVTGANSGIGYETARVLAQKGATVVMACRNLEKARNAAEQIQALGLTGQLEVMELDLADLESVQRFTAAFRANYRQLDLLINNAGIMVPPKHGSTKQSFETQFGVNHLGHFALTSQLIDLLNSTPNGRIVTVSSIAHRFGEINFDDLNWQSRDYDPMPAYGQSKLANLLFTYELQRRLTAADHTTIAVAAHPGYTATGRLGRTDEWSLFDRLMKQKQGIGALPTLYAATAAEAEGGRFYGPSSIGELWGSPQRVESTDASHDEAVARRLWQVSEQLTDSSFTF